MTRVYLSVPLMHHDPDRSWITDPDADHPKGTQPKLNDVNMTRWVNMFRYMYWSVEGCAAPRCHFLMVIPNSVHSNTETLIFMTLKVPMKQTFFRHNLKYNV